MERPIAVPRPANPLVKQGPDSPVSVFEFERKKRRSKSKGKSEFRGLYPPPRPPKRTDSSSPPLRRCLSEPVTPPSPEKVACRPDHEVSGNVLSELNSGNGNPRALCFDSDSADPAEAPASCGSRAVSSPLAGKENRGKVASAGAAWKDGMRTTGCSEIEEVDCGRGAADKTRACAVLQGMTPFAFWSPVPGANGAVEHRKILYAAPIRAEVEEQVIININFHKVSKRDLQLNRRESRRLVLLFILFNLLFGGLLIFRIPRAGERGILTPRITRTEQLLNLPDNLGTKLQLYRKLLGPKERVLALDSGQGLNDMRVTALQTLWQHYPAKPWIFPFSSAGHRGLEEEGATTSSASLGVQESFSGEPTVPKT